MSTEKLREIQRNLAEQESFVQSIMQQRQKKPRTENNANIDNILTSSIQKAKQKISSLDGKSQPPRNDRSTQNLSTSRQKKQRSEGEGSAIAAAMKKLQERISSLQQQNCKLNTQNKQSRKREQSQVQKNEGLKRNLQENKRKIKNLQSSIEHDKSWIKELQRKNDTLQKQLTNRKITNNSDELEKKLSTSQMMFRAQEQQFRNLVSENQLKERKLLELENKRREQQIRFQQQLNILNSLNRQFELKMATLEQKNKQKDQLIQSLKNEVKNMGAEKLKCSTIALNNSSYENQQRQILQSRASRRRALQTEINANNELQQLKDKYDELLTAYKNLDDRSRQDKNEAKNYRNKFWQLKEAVKELIDKIQGLPAGVIAQLKFLIVKINKIQAFSTDYFAATPTKSARKSSILNSSTERSKSNSRKKSTTIMNIELNRSSNSAKSKRSSHTNRSTDSNKKSRSKLKSKEVIVSTKSIKKSEVAEIEAEAQQIRRRYKQLVGMLNKNNNDSDQKIRDQLNDLALLLNQKSQQITKLKKKK